MKKSLIFLMLLLMLTSCKAKPDNEIAQPHTEEPMPQIEDTAPTKPSEEAQADTKPDVTTEPETDRIEGQWQDSDDGQSCDILEVEQEQQEEILIDGYVVHNGGLISKEMKNRDYQYVLGACGYSPSTLESLKEMSDLIVVATPKTTFDEAEQIWRSGNSPTTDFNKAEMATSYTKRTFTVKEVIKGEQVDEIDVYERAITDGVKTRIAEFEFIADKGEDYLLFLYKAGDSGAYLTPQDSGKYNTNKMYNNKTDLFKEVFEEYMTHFTWIEP